MTSLLPLNDRANVLSFSMGSQYRGPLLSFDPTTVFFSVERIQENL